MHATYRTKWRSGESYLNKFSLQRFESRVERSDCNIKSTNTGHEGVQREKKYSSTHSQPRHEIGVGGRHTPSVNKKVQLDATVCRHLFTAQSLYMFRVSQHPSSGVLKTISATSGIGHDAGTATSFHRGLIRTGVSESCGMFLVLLMMGAVTPETCRVTVQ